MSKQMGQYFLVKVENDKIRSCVKLKPDVLLNLIKDTVYLALSDYKELIDYLDNFPVDLTAGYSKPVQLYDEQSMVNSLYPQYHMKRYIVFAYNKTKAERALIESNLGIKQGE